MYLTLIFLVARFVGMSNSSSIDFIDKLKVSSVGGKRSTEEDIQSGNNDASGEEKIIETLSTQHILVSADDTINCIAGHSVDVKDDRNSVVL